MRRIIRSDLVRTAYSNPLGISVIELSESGADAKLKKLYVKGVPTEGYVIDLDAATCTFARGAHRFPQFSAHIDRRAQAVNKICDAVLVLEAADAIHAALVDLKSSSPNFSELQIQLANSQHFIEYVHRLIQWRDGERRPIRPTRHVVMLANSKSAAGGRQKTTNHVEYVGVHGVAVNGKGQASVNWSSFF